MTAWAVVLPENQVRCYFLFRYLDLPGGHFQEQFSIDPIGNYPTRDYSARLLWDQSGSVRTVQPQVHLAGGQMEEEAVHAVWRFTRNLVCSHFYSAYAADRREIR